MARFDVFVNPDGHGWLVDVQTDMLADLNTRLVIPLLPRHNAPKPARRLNPVFRIGDEDVVLVPQFLAAIPVIMLGDPCAHFAAHQDEITAALDMIFLGF